MRQPALASKTLSNERRRLRLRVPGRTGLLGEENGAVVVTRQ